MLNERSSYSLVFYISRTRPKTNGECPIYMRITINGDRVNFPIKRHILPELWSTERNEMIGRTQEAQVFNKYLEAIRLRTNKLYNELLVDHAEITPPLLRDAILGVNTARGKTIISVWNDYVERLESLVGIETSYANMQKYRTARGHFQDFLKFKYRIHDVSIKRIDHRMIEGFEDYLRTQRGCGYNTSIKFLQNLKRIVMDCIRNGWLQKNPFANKSLTLKEVARPYLNEEELQRILALEIKIERLDRIRDFFLFACFTGLSYSDVKKLKREEVEFTSDGYWIKTRRTKTGVTTNVPLLEVPWKILMKYNPHFEDLFPSDKMLPIMSNQKLNSYLKEIADLSHITKPLTFHTARHTFATTVTLLNGVPIESVSKMLGHKNITSTQHYARIVDQKVGQDMKILASRLEGKINVNWG